MRWRERRLALEAGGARNTVLGPRMPDEAKPRRHLSGLFGHGLRATGLMARGRRNARKLRLVRREVAFDDLPAAFDGYTLLHLTDPHFDGLPGIAETVAELVAGLAVDLSALTGDYRYTMGGGHEHILDDLARVVGAIEARDGILATLGNHDGADLVPALEALGVRVLINETVRLVRGNEAMLITGLDDVSYYYTDAAPAALAASAAADFKLALVHSAEMAAAAARAGYAFYLAGHTHGGQICLPGGRPVVTNLHRHRAYARGLWRRGRMVGYTSPGIGVSLLPVRFNTRPEVTLFTLRRRRGQSAG